MAKIQYSEILQNFTHQSMVYLKSVQLPISFSHCFHSTNLDYFKGHQSIRFTSLWYTWNTVSGPHTASHSQFNKTCLNLDLIRSQKLEFTSLFIDYYYCTNCGLSPTTYFSSTVLLYYCESRPQRGQRVIKPLVD